jgi:hypothetical protein
MRLLMPAFLALLASACGSVTGPDDPPVNRVTFAGTVPRTDSTLIVPAEWPYIIPGGVVIPRGSGFLPVGLTVASGRDVPWARLSVYLLTGDTTTSICGQNDPDAPTWGGLPAGWSTTYTVTGFRVYRLPCEVTGIRAVLHTRNNGLLTPPLPSEIVAEAVLPVRLHLRRAAAPE